MRRKGVELNAEQRRAAREISAQLRKRGIAHALVGGLAVCAHGYRRTTDDVDFLVSAEAEVELGGDALGGATRGKTIRTTRGVTVDFLFPASGEEYLEKDILGSEGSPPVISREALVCMKMVAGRMKDSADVVELLKRGRLDSAAVTRYLERHRPDLTEDFVGLVALAKVEKD